MSSDALLRTGPARPAGTEDALDAHGRWCLGAALVLAVVAPFLLVALVVGTWRWEGSVTLLALGTYGPPALLGLAALGLALHATRGGRRHG